jgi:Ca2+-binding EF-hand superfamily protein
MAVVCECFTDDQLKQFRRVFDHYDADKDQHIAKPEEFRRALKSLGICPTAEELRAMCSASPAPTMDLPEFISIIYYFLRGGDSPKELTRAFAVFDRDNQGTIPRETAKQILANLKHPLPEDQIDELLEKLDERGLINYARMIAELKPT